MHLSRIKSQILESGQTTKRARTIKLKPICMFRLMEIEKMKNLWSCLLCLVIKIEREIEQGSGQTAILVNVRWVLAASCVTAIGRPTACHRTWPFRVEVREWARGNCEGRQGAQEGRHRLTAWVEAPVDGSFFRAELSWSLATWVIVGLLWAFSIGWVRLWACGCRCLESNVFKSSSRT